MTLLTETAYPTLFTPIKIGALEIPNRILMATIDSVFRTVEGESNEQHRDYLVARARGGVGLIISDNLVVEYPRGAVGSRAGRIDQNRFVASLNDLVENVHLAGGIIAAQLNHAGRQTTLGGSQGHQLVSASAIPWAESQTVPRELTTDEVYELITAFRASAARAKQAGFDAVQVHAAHGYLLSSFLSPALNHRTDEFGGSTPNRARIVQLIVEGIKEDLGTTYPVIVRINCDDGLPDGIKAPEAAEIGKILEDAGTDALDVSAGTYEHPQLTYTPMMYPQGALMDRIETVRAAVNIPVIGVGKIQTPEAAEQFLQAGKIDLVAIGRSLIADPRWAEKAKAGRPENIRPCIACNHACIHRIDQNLTMRCNVNPELGREGKTWFGGLSPTRHRSKIVVVGAGPAGSEFAIRASAEGEDVVLLDAQPGPGGQLRFAQIPDFKQDLGRLVRYYDNQLKHSKVETHYNTWADRESILSHNPDLVVFATGGVAARPFKGAEHLPTYQDIFEGHFTPEKEVTVLGGGPVGCEVAVFLARAGHKITIIEQDTVFARTEDPSVQAFFAEEFTKWGITPYLEHQISETTKIAVTFAHLTDREPKTINSGSIVLASGVRSERELADSFQSDIPHVVIGDARRVATVYEATQHAYHEVQELTRRGLTHAR